MHPEKRQSQESRAVTVDKERATLPCPVHWSSWTGLCLPQEDTVRHRKEPSWVSRKTRAKAELEPFQFCRTIFGKVETGGGVRSE